MAGMTLLEILVAMAIGSLVITAVLNMYVNALESASYQNSQSRVQESGRFALDHMARTLRMARYDDPVETTTAAIVPGLYGTTSADSAIVMTGYTLKTGTDVVQVSHEGADVNPVTLVREITDCRGQIVTEAQWVTNTYAISSNDELLCSTSASNALVIAEGIEDMQLLYGVDTDTDGVANQYLAESNVTTANWPNVVSVRITLLVNSVETVFNKSLRGCESCITFNPSASNYLRGEFHSTVRIRNL
jgi:type IV pilus assembly protein PilW